MGSAGFVLAGGRYAAELDCLAPVTAPAVEPWCAVHHRRVAGAAKRALHHKLLKMQDFFRTIHTAEEWLAGVSKPVESNR